MDRMTPARDDLVRMVPLEASALRASGDGRTLYGYPIVFNNWTEIDSWEGKFRERVAPSAVAKTLAERGDQVKVLFNHGYDPQIGDKPLGKPTVQRADATGLYTETPLSDTSYNQDLAALIRDGAIDGMSFRFSVPKGGERIAYPDEDGHSGGSLLPERTITELKLYEYGPVTFPAYEASSAGVRSREGFEMWRGLSERGRAQVRRLVTFDAQVRSDGDDDPTTLAEAADAVNDSLYQALLELDTDQALALSSALDVTLDALILALGGTDADDDEDSTSAAAEMVSAKLAGLSERTRAALADMAQRTLAACPANGAVNGRVGTPGASLRRAKTLATMTRKYR